MPPLATKLYSIVYTEIPYQARKICCLIMYYGKLLNRITKYSHFVQKNNHEVVTYAEVRLVEFVGHVEAEALEFPALQKDSVEPGQ